MFVLSLVFTASADDVLPVQRIRFYETGVAWFEREGEVSSGTALPVPTSHLDDALKTLVVLGGDVDLGAITFPTALGDDAARVNAGLETSQHMGFSDALHALLGVRVALEADSGPLEGVLIDVEGPLEVVRPESTDPLTLAPQFALTVLGDDGTIHRTTTDRVSSVRSDEPEVTERLATAARTMARTRAQRANALDVQLTRGGRLGLGYLAEAPVWRISYRVIDPEDGTADLQAWALVHNDTDEAWQDIQVELANGEPDSFLFPLAAPRYAERELRTPDKDLATVSQLATATPDEMWNAASSGAFGLGSAGYGLGGGGSAFGSIGSGSIGSVVAQLKTAEPVETPTQFVYRVLRPVDLPAHHTALVPIVQEGVPAETAVVFEPGSIRARNGMWFENGTDRTLPAGVVSVLQSGGLAGEARLERLKPGETQMVTFGNELDVDLSRNTHARDPVPESLTLVDQMLRLDSVVDTAHTFDVRNRSGRTRDLWFALELSPGQDVTDAVRTEIDPHQGWTWVVLEAEAGSAEQQVSVRERRAQTLDPAGVTAKTWREWAQLGIADPAALERAASIRESLDALQAQRHTRVAEQQRAQSELDGLRKTLTAADGSSSATPITRRATSVEGELRKLDDRLAELDRKREALLDEMLSVLGDGSVDAADL